MKNDQNAAKRVCREKYENDDVHGMPDCTVNAVQEREHLERTEGQEKREPEKENKEEAEVIEEKEEEFGEKRRIK